MILCYKTFLICAHSRDVCMQTDRHTHTYRVPCAVFFFVGLRTLFCSVGVQPSFVSISIFCRHQSVLAACKQRERTQKNHHIRNRNVQCALVGVRSMCWLRSFGCDFSQCHITSSRLSSIAAHVQQYNQWDRQPKWRHKSVHYIPHIIATNS